MSSCCPDCRAPHAARLWPARGPLADARLLADAPGREDRVREELAAGVILDREVRFRGQTGKRVLILSLTAFEPKRFAYRP